jgi:hypothetical protein
LILCVTQLNHAYSWHSYPGSCPARTSTSAYPIDDGDDPSGG